MAGSKGEMLMPLSRTCAWGLLGSFARSSGPSAFSGQLEGGQGIQLSDLSTHFSQAPAA